MLATIQKWGNSQGVRLPLGILGEAGLAQGNEVIISAEEDKIVITLAHPRRRKKISELFEGYDGAYEPVDIDWGKPAGKEIW